MHMHLVHVGAGEPISSSHLIYTCQGKKVVAELIPH